MRPQQKRLELRPQPYSPRTRASLIVQLTFALWEMAEHRDFQEKLRAEINETLARVKARGDTDFTANDFESMPYLVAITKVRPSYVLCG